MADFSTILIAELKKLTDEDKIKACLIADVDNLEALKHLPKDVLNEVVTGYGWVREVMLNTNTGKLRLTSNNSDNIFDA